MRIPIRTNRFKKDLERMIKHGKNGGKARYVLSSLIEERPLESVFHDHPLSGDWTDRRECHIEPDWLLIYKIEKDRIIFERTGTHSDLFG